MSDNWQSFADAMADENRALAELGAASLRLTEVLVAGVPAEIEQIERRLEAMRVLHAHAHGRRNTMQKRGFGELTLRQVCAYAPAPLRRGVYTTLHELTTRAIALSMTVNNNKALILAGMNRITRTVEVMQQTMSEQPGTYKRRGTIPPASGSVIVSRRA
ncbi:MAG: flagellar export chaperone FlgN [Candidatus Velthaea sp.]